MALNQTRSWLVAYDLRDHLRITRVHRLLTKVAVPVQYSVFVARGSHKAMVNLAQDIEALIDGKVDDVRMYPIPARPWVHNVGRAMLPEDLLLIDTVAGLDALLGRGTARDPARI